MGVVVKVRFLVVMAAFEARVEGFCRSARFGGSLHRQKATSSPQVAEGLLSVRQGSGRVAWRVNGGACGRQIGQGASGGCGLEEGHHSNGPWPSGPLPLRYLGGQSLSVWECALCCCSLCPAPPPPFLTALDSVHVVADVHDTIWD